MTAIVPEGMFKKGYYSPTEAARLMEVTRTTIYRMIDDGRLKVAYRKSNKQMVVTGRSMVEYIEGVI